MIFSKIDTVLVLIMILVSGGAKAQVPGSLSDLDGKFKFKRIHLAQLGVFRPESAEIDFLNSDLSKLDLSLSDSVDKQPVQTSLIFAGHVPREIYLGEIPGSFVSFRAEKFPNGGLKFLEVLSLGQLSPNDIRICLIHERLFPEARIINPPMKYNNRGVPSVIASDCIDFERVSDSPSPIPSAEGLQENALEKIQPLSSCGQLGSISERINDCKTLAKQSASSGPFFLVMVQTHSDGSQSKFYKDRSHIWSPVIPGYFYEAQIAINFCASLNSDSPLYSYERTRKYMGTLADSKEITWSLPTREEFLDAGDPIKRDGRSNPLFQKFLPLENTERLWTRSRDIVFEQNVARMYSLGDGSPNSLTYTMQQPINLRAKCIGKIDVAKK